MNTLALDLGTHTGYSYNDGDDFYCGTWKLATPAQIKEQRKKRLDRRGDCRIHGLYGAISMVLKTHRINAVVFEDVQFSSSTMQTQLWASLRAAVWLASAGIFVECVPVGTLKKFAGHGAASKEQMGTFLTQRDNRFFLDRERKVYFRNFGREGLTSYPWTPIDDNAVDAVWLWHWAKANLGRTALK
jgi:Holliday junction resolvasome RuvABC endonuclease subunit